jgi:Xaa-Pro aminopeptidase
MPDLLIHGAPDSSPDLFHVIPYGIIDPFLYADTDGRRAATVSVLDAHKVSALGIEVLDSASLGADQLVASGLSRYEVDLEISLRACRELGLERAIVPPEFPLGVADHLRAGGMTLDVDPDAFVLRRRAKTDAQLAGIRRAQKAADAAMAVAADMIHELRPGLTSEEIRAAMTIACDERGCDLPGDVIVAHGPQSADGHESGFGALEAGADGQAIFRRSCEPFIEAGKPTQLTKQEDEVLRDGYFHGLGHGVGLEVHERPGLGRAPDTLRTGDVITLEPGCYRRGYGGVRLEDLVVVTGDGCETLTDFPYDL